MAATEPIPEPLNGGLVTARDPALLEAGELVQTDDMVYYPNDPAVHKVKGRTKYNSAALGSAGTVKGLRYLEFDDTQNGILVGHESDDLLLSSFSDETGTFGTITPISNVGNGPSLDVVQFENRYVALIGAGTNQVINSQNVGRRHGLNPVPRLPTLGETGAPTLISGAFNVELGAGYFHFLTTEVVKDGAGPDIESTYDGVPATHSTAFTTASLTTQAVQITKPLTVNSNATHWRVYMAGPTTSLTPVPSLALFRQVAESDIATTVIVIGNKGQNAGHFPGTTQSNTGWTSPDNGWTEDGVYTTTNTSGAVVHYRNFLYGGGEVTGTVRGIEVIIKASMTTPGFAFVSQSRRSNVALKCELTNDGATFYPTFNAQYFPLNDSGIYGNFVAERLGNPNNLWGRASWATSDFNGNVNFGVRLTYTVFTTGDVTPTINLDFVEVIVYTSGTTQPVNLFGKPFRTVNVSVAGITSTFGSDGPPPIATTGDIFEDQLVLNDVTDSSLIRYSLPGSIESFPGIYFLNFESKTQDRVTNIRRLGNKLIVGLTQQLNRVNYLPRETDAEFDRGRCYEPISETEGIVGPQSSCLFSPDGGALLLAYISHSGPRYTDGFQSFSLSDDLDWPATVRLPVAGSPTNYLQNCVLVNYALLQQIWFYYTPPGQTTNTKALVFHYNKAHGKGRGTFKVTGPINVAALSATTGRVGGNEVLLSGQSGGFVYVEDRGYTDASGGTLAFAVKTREIYTAGAGRSATVENLFIRHNQDATTTVTVTPYTRYSNSAQTTQSTKTFSTVQAGLIKLPFHLNHESIQWKLSEEPTVGTAGVRLSGLIMETKGTGLPEPRP